MISGRRKPIASLVLAGSLLLSGQSDAAAASTPSISNNRNGRRGGYNEHHNRQLRTRKLSKGSERSEPGGDVATRNANGDGGGFPPPVLAGCFRDFKVCDATGTLVSRNAALGCDFDPCPPAGHGDKADSDNNTSYPTEGGNQNEPPANDAPKTYTPIGIIEENMPVTPERTHTPRGTPIVLAVAGEPPERTTTGPLGDGDASSFVQIGTDGYLSTAPSVAFAASVAPRGVAT